MTSFQYEAIKKSGEVVTGTLEADGQGAVAERLRGMGLMATEIKEVKPSSSSFSIFKRKKKVKLGDLSLFSRQLAAMLNAGIPLTRALYTLSRQVENQTLSVALTEISRNVEGGSSLSESLKGYPHIFSELYVNMVNAGESGGSLELSLNRLSNQLQKSKELQDNIKSAMFYPVVVLGFAVIILFAMLFFLVPIFMGFFPEGAELPAPTMMIIALSNLARNYWFIIFPLLILLFFLASSYIKSKKGKEKIDRLTYNMPIFGPLIQKTAVANFARTFSTMLSTGIPVVQALDASGKASGNTLVIEAAITAGEKIQEGSSVAEPLEESGVFPPMVTHMIAVGEETGDIPEMMDKVAAFFEEEVATITKGLTSLIEPLMLVFIGVLVGGMLIALYLPIFTVITQI
ncbi:MAG: type II secretion system F family protein [Bacillota bacterium]|nr:type II secretion system F family protein [Bacillota bacterium]